MEKGFRHASENRTVFSGATIFQAAGTDDPMLVQLILGAVSSPVTDEKRE
jgi:hypothetical protein